MIFYSNIHIVFIRIFVIEKLIETNTILLLLITARHIKIIINWKMIFFRVVTMSTLNF